MRNFHLAGRSTVHAQNAMVATSHPLAALTAIEVLRSGGTAADAAVAACALLGVIEPQSTGIGGDCFALVQPRGKARSSPITARAARRRRPTPSWYLERNINAIPLTSAHAVTIPGAVDAWTTILRDHGKLGFDTLLQPAIKAAEEGYVVAPRIAFDWKNQFEKLKKGTNTRALSAAARQAGGRRRRDPAARARKDAAGDRKRWPRRVLQRRRSPRTWSRPCAASAACTRSTISQTIPPRPRSPIGTVYKGHDVWQCPPNGPGITMLVMLNILSRFDLTKFPALSVERFHLEAEAARIAYMMREQHIGDPAHVNVDVSRILTPEFAEEYGGKIRMDRHARPCRS